MSATNRVQSRRDINQAAQNEGAAVLLDPIGGHQIHLATEQGFQAISQVDEAEADGLGEARQQVHVAAGRWLIGGEGAEQLQRAELELGSQGRVVLTQHRQHLSAVRAGWRDGSRHGAAGLLIQR